MRELEVMLSDTHAEDLWGENSHCPQVPEEHMWGGRGTTLEWSTSEFCNVKRTALQVKSFCSWEVFTPRLVALGGA